MLLAGSRRPMPFNSMGTEMSCYSANRAGPATVPSTQHGGTSRAKRHPAATKWCKKTDESVTSRRIRRSSYAGGTGSTLPGREGNWHPNR